MLKYGGQKLRNFHSTSTEDGGTHNELLEKKGIYYNLVTAQLAMAEGKYRV